MNQFQSFNQPPVWTILVPTQYISTGWSFEDKGDCIKAQNITNPSKVCTIILRKDPDLQTTYNRIYSQIDKNYKPDEDLWP